MAYLEMIIKLGAVIGAFLVIWKAIMFFVRFADDVKDIKRHTEENYLMVLRLTIMSNEMPLGERIVAADKYLHAGGNGDVKHFIETELHTKDIVKE